MQKRFFYYKLSCGEDAVYDAVKRLKGKGKEILLITPNRGLRIFFKSRDIGYQYIIYLFPKA